MPSGVYNHLKGRKHTNPNCQCPFCKARRGEYKGETHHNFGKHWHLSDEAIEKRKKNCEGFSGKHHSKETIEKMIEAHTGHIVTEETLRKMIASGKKKWQNLVFREKQLKTIFKGLDIKPNKPETLLNSILQNLFPNQYKYVGDGQVIIGGKCPDFINTSNKKIIELFGDYWHKSGTEQARIDLFAKYGYQTLIVWEYELKNIEQLKIKLVKFVGLK